MKIPHLILFILTLIPNIIQAQDKNISTENWMTSPGILGTVTLIIIVIVVAMVIFLVRINSYLDSFKKKQEVKIRTAFDDELVAMEDDQIDTILEQRKAALKYKLKGNELSGENEVYDKKGLIQKITNDPNNAFFDEKKKTSLSLETPEPLKKIVIYYLGGGYFLVSTWNFNWAIFRYEIYLARNGFPILALFWKIASGSYQYGILGLVFFSYDWPWSFCNRSYF